MIRRLSIFALVATTVTALGCAAPTEQPDTEESIGQTAAALTVVTNTVDDTDIDGATPQAWTLTYFDGTALTAIKDTTTFTAPFSSATKFKAANLSKYTPGDPCRTFALNYNTATSSELRLSAIGSLATNNCQARVWLKSNVIRAFRPVP